MSVEPRSDVVSVLPEVASIREMVQASDYAGVGAALIALHDQDDQLLADAGALLAEEPGFHALVEERVRRAGDDILARSLLAHSHIAGAWRSRGRLAAAKVPPADFERFLAQLRLAEVDLIELCAMEPTWSYPWYLRLITARGLELGISEARRRYDRLAEHDPHHHPAQAQLLQQLCPKWDGTWELAEKLARDCVRDARAGSPENAVLATLHLERWLALDPREGAAHLRGADTLQDLHSSADASVNHPDYRRGLSWVRLHSTYGVLFALAGERDAALRHFAELGDVVDPQVWGYLGAKDVAVVQKVRKAGRTRTGAP